MSEILFQKELFIPSTIEGLSRCLDIIDEVKGKFDLEHDTIFSLHTCVVESVENAFIHGNKYCKDLNVRFFISVSNIDILVEVEDAGDGFDLHNIPSPFLNSRIKKEGGRGIYFIKALSLSCYTLGRGNIIRIKIKR